MLGKIKAAKRKSKSSLYSFLILERTMVQFGVWLSIFLDMVLCMCIYKHTYIHTALKNIIIAPHSFIIQWLAIFIYGILLC